MSRYTTIVLKETAKVHILPALEDNYIFIVEWSDGLAVIDPGQAGPVKDFVDAQSKTLQYILNTHAHFDHVAGNTALKDAYGCTVVGPATNRIPALDRSLHEGDKLQLGPFSFDIIETPGHTRNDISYYCERHEMLFCGDTLFAGGCGRLFEGTEDDMWHSLCKIRALPDRTSLFCGHEYTLGNLRFAADRLPGNTAISDRLREVEQLRSHGAFTVPTSVAQEKQTNLFLMCDDQQVLKALGLAGCRPSVAFGDLRTQKNQC